MSGGILRFPWTSQPQSPVRIDWGNPLSRDLAFVAIGGQPIDLVNGKLGTYVGTAGVGCGPKGKAFTTASGAANRIDFTKASPANRTGELSFGSIFKVDSDTGALQYLINRDAIANLFMVRSGALTIQQTWNATGLFQSTNVVVAGTWNIASSSSPPFGSSTALDAKLWLNRRKEVAGNATNGALGTTSLGDTILHGRVSDNLRQVNGAQALAVSWNRVLSDAEHASWQADPWQLFAPIRRKIWVPNAGGGGPTYTLTADSASYTLTGQATGLTFNRVLTADTQSYTLTGQAATLAFNRAMVAASAAYTLTGQDAGLAFNRVLSAANGSYALDGQDVTLTYTPISGATYTLGAASGSFALTGQDTGIAFNRVLTADTQSYSLSGQTAGLAFNRVLTADTVSYALTGQDAALTYTGNTYTLNAESGTFFVDGQDANLVYSGGSSADTGDGSMSRKRYYLRRKGKILLFDTAAQADDYLEAEEEAQKAIQAAKSRGAKKRIAAKILKAVEPVESVEIAPLQELVKAYSVPVNLPQLLTQQDYQQVMDVRAMIQRIQDDEDDELLLLLA